MRNSRGKAFSHTAEGNFASHDCMYESQAVSCTGLSADPVSGFEALEGEDVWFRTVPCLQGLCLGSGWLCLNTVTERSREQPASS